MATYHACPNCDRDDGKEVWRCDFDGTEFCKSCATWNGNYWHCPTCYDGSRDARERFIGYVK